MLKKSSGRARASPTLAVEHHEYRKPKSARQLDISTLGAICNFPPVEWPGQKKMAPRKKVKVVMVKPFRSACAKDVETERDSTSDSDSDSATSETSESAASDDVQNVNISDVSRKPVKTRPRTVKTRVRCLKEQSQRRVQARSTRQGSIHIKIHRSPRQTPARAHSFEASTRPAELPSATQLPSVPIYIIASPPPAPTLPQSTVFIPVAQPQAVPVSISQNLPSSAPLAPINLSEADRIVAEKVKAHYHSMQQNTMHVRNNSSLASNYRSNGHKPSFGYKHVCFSCGTVRSRGYHREHTVRRGKAPRPSLCMVCREQLWAKATSSSLLQRIKNFFSASHHKGEPERYMRFFCKLCGTLRSRLYHDAFPPGSQPPLPDMCSLCISKYNRRHHSSDPEVCPVPYAYSMLARVVWLMSC